MQGAIASFKLVIGTFLNSNPFKLYTFFCDCESQYDFEPTLSPTKRPGCKTGCGRRVSSPRILEEQLPGRWIGRNGHRC